MQIPRYRGDHSSTVWCSSREGGDPGEGKGSSLSAATAKAASLGRQGRRGGGLTACCPASPCFWKGNLGLIQVCLFVQACKTLRKGKCCFQGRADCCRCPFFSLRQEVSCKGYALLPSQNLNPPQLALPVHSVCVFPVNISSQAHSSCASTQRGCRLCRLHGAVRSRFFIKVGRNSGKVSWVQSGLQKRSVLTAGEG